MSLFLDSFISDASFNSNVSFSSDAAFSVMLLLASLYYNNIRTLGETAHMLSPNVSTCITATSVVAV